MRAPMGAPQLLFIVLLSVISIALAGLSFDFEDMTELDHFAIAGDSVMVLSQDYSKGGSASLLWHWTETNPQTKLALNLGDVKLRGKVLKDGGMKFWMYIPGSTGVVANPNPDPCTGDTDNNSPITVTQLDVQFLDTSALPHKSWETVRIHLGFTGSWRAVWIPFTDLRKGSSTRLESMDRVEFSFPNTESSEGDIYIDLLRFVPSVSKPSRDRVVPKIVHPYDVEWSDKEHWQQTLRWSCQAVPGADTDPSEVSLLEEITKIENRFDNWYADKTKGLHNDGLTEEEAASEPTNYETFRAKRWKGLLKSIDLGNANYEKLEKNEAGDKIIGPALFTKVSDLGTEDLGDDQIKFTVVMEKILLPLALEYYLRSRTKEVNDVVDAECNKLASSDSIEKTQGLANIAGKSQVMMDYLDSQLGLTVIDCATDKARIITAVEGLNAERLRRLVLLLEYVEVQGWTYGSGLGSIDHEMNKNGAGFMNGIFLLRNALRHDHSEQLDRWIETAKWYTDFNEIYQLDADYVYDGTTADRMRTILLYRMMIVLMTPSGSEKIRDMENLKTWAEHALKINKALGGVIKPDYTGFHHMTFYGAAYVPHALHNAALVQYLLEGTSFALSSDAKRNLRKALEVMRVVAVKYSTPNSISGRFPSYNKAVLAETTPAYAYISYVHASQNAPATVNHPKMFLRLYDYTEPAMKEILGKGAISSSIYYLNSIGALDIMEKVKTLAGTQEQDLLSGHWSKNFAALSIHRRNNWLVAAKGFNHYVWDYEHKENKENVYGVFVSYGSLQISNSEAALTSYDVKSGWDWTRIPGATTMSFELENIKTKKARYYNQRSLAGGVSLRGDSNTDPQNGVFGMRFKIPEYEIENRLSPLKNIKFEFHKSYFFLDDLIVSVGEVLKFKGAGILQADQLPDEYYPQTTLFQDKLVNPNGKTSIKIDDDEYDLRILLEDQSEDLQSKTIDLEDTLGNIYRFDNNMNNELHVQISEQKSKADDGCKSTKDTYATAWIKHKKSNGAYTSYHYAILVSDTGTPVDKNTFDKFSVVQNDDAAHIVKFTEPEVITTGYVVFTSGTPFVTGPVETVDSTCTIMTEEKDSSVTNEKILHIAISYPAWKFKNDTVMVVKPTCTNHNLKPPTLQPTSISEVGPKLLFCVEGEGKNIRVTLRHPVTSTTPTDVWVDDEDKTGHVDEYVSVDSTANKIVTFKNLKNGFTTEAVFKYTTGGGGAGGAGGGGQPFAKHVKARFRRAFNSTSND